MNKSNSSLGSKTKFKIVFLGDSNTGKTSIIERFINNQFQDKANPTIGIDFLGKNVPYKNKNYRLQLWDTAGQERFRSLIPSYLKDAICALYVFDVNNPDSLESIDKWIQLFRQNKGLNTVSAICGNKIDLEKMYEKSKLDKILQKNRIPFFQISAKTGDKIDDMFFHIIDMINELNSKIKKPQKVQQHDDLMPPLTTEPIRLDQVTTTAEDLIEKPQTRKCCFL